MTNEEILEFLKESNAIEDVWDADSLLQAYYAWEYLRPLRKIKPSNILKAHKILMLHQTTLQPSEKGYFRRCEVAVGGKETANWGFIPEFMAQWCNCYSTVDEEAIRQNHISFEQVHPFADGNGRIGRLLMNWQRVKAGLPILVIKEKEKQEYYDWFLEEEK